MGVADASSTQQLVSSLEVPQGGEASADANIDDDKGMYDNDTHTITIDLCKKRKMLIRKLRKHTHELGNSKAITVSEFRLGQKFPRKMLLQQEIR